MSKAQNMREYTSRIMMLVLACSSTLDGLRVNSDVKKSNTRCTTVWFNIKTSKKNLKVNKIEF